MAEGKTPGGRGPGKVRRGAAPVKRAAAPVKRAAVPVKRAAVPVKRAAVPVPAADSRGERLQKVMAHAGVASRRHSEELIQAGRVTVNGQVVTQLGTRVKRGERVEVDGRPLTGPEQLVYILLNKPRYYVTTLYDPQNRPTVIDLVRGVRERVYPVGRLDFDTEGVMLLTNDGRLSHALAHPGRLVKKTYLARVRGVPSAASLKRLREGVELDDGPTAPAEVKLLSSADGLAVVSVTIHEGRNRQVRRMFEAVGHEVIGLRRARLGGLGTEGLAPGQWRELTAEEVRDLYHHAGLKMSSGTAGARSARAVARPAPAGGRRQQGPRPEGPWPQEAPARPPARGRAVVAQEPGAQEGRPAPGRTWRPAPGLRGAGARPGPGGKRPGPVGVRPGPGGGPGSGPGRGRDKLPPGPLGGEIRQALARLAAAETGEGEERPARGQRPGRSPAVGAPNRPGRGPAAGAPRGPGRGPAAGAPRGSGRGPAAGAPKGPRRPGGPRH